MIIDRRSFLGKSGAAGLGLAGAHYGVGQTAKSSLPHLKDLAAAAGLTYGSDSDSAIAQQPPEYGALFAAQCALYAVIFDWSRSNPKSPFVNVWVDPNIEFARAHGLKLTGGIWCGTERLRHGWMVCPQRLPKRRS